MRLDEQAGVALVGLAQVLARRHGFGEARCQVVGLADAQAVGARPQKSGRPSLERALEAVERLGRHLRQLVFPRAARSRQDDGVRQAIARQHLAQAKDGFGVAVEIGERHERV